MKPKASVLTPAGRGAIATIRVWGPGAAAAVERWFRPARGGTLRASPIDRIVFGQWRDELCASFEEVVVCRVAEQNGEGGDEAVEVHCHGGHAAVERILVALGMSGCEVAPWQVWVTDTYGEGVRAAAIKALSAARTERTAAILLDQYCGALASAVARIDERLRTGQADAARRGLEEIIGRSRIGLRLTEPFRVVLAGAPNVGKSSLINALLGYHRAIVFDEPGTTRDVLTAQTALDGWLVELADTAGMRVAAEEIESTGVARATEEVADADLVLWVRDASRPDVDDEAVRVLAGVEPLMVWNKCDLVGGVERWARGGMGVDPHPVASTPPPSATGRGVSALTGDGMKELAQAMVERLCPSPPARGDAVPFTHKQVEALDGALACVAAGELKAARNLLAGFL